MKPKTDAQRLELGVYKIIALVLAVASSVAAFTVCQDDDTALGFKVAIVLTFIVVYGGIVWIVSQMERLFDRLNELE